jgi:hypothetical protein
MAANSWNRNDPTGRPPAGRPPKHSGHLIVRIPCAAARPMVVLVLRRSVEFGTGMSPGFCCALCRPAPHRGRMLHGLLPARPWP